MSAKMTYTIMCGHHVMQLFVIHHAKMEGIVHCLDIAHVNPLGKV